MSFFDKILNKKQPNGKPRLVGMSGGKAPAPKPAPKEQQPAPKEQKVASKSLLAPMQPYLSVISSDIKCFLHVDERARKERETYSDTTGERLRKTLSKLR